MMTEFEIVPSETTYRVGRYPWERLSEVGNELVLFGRKLNRKGARQSIHMFAKRHGWKVRYRDMGMTSRGWCLHLVRTA